MKRAATKLDLVDDATILRLAADQSRPLFQVVERASALRPLVVVLAVLPGLIALEHRELQEESAVWGLRALDVLNAESLSDALNPGQSPETQGLGAQPPLATWLTAMIFQFVGTARLPVSWIPSLLAGAGAVWWTFRLFSILEGTRIGFWGTLFIATHAGILLAATSASPSIVTLFFVLVWFDAWFRHLRHADGMVSSWLMLAGIATGLTLLSGGPAILAGFAVIVSSELIKRILNRTAEVRERIPTSQVAAGLGVLLLTAFALGGWWVLQAASSLDEFWMNWWSGYDAALAAIIDVHSTAAANENPAGKSLVHFLNVIGPLLPMTLLGLVCCLLRLLTERDSHRQGKSIVLLCWLAVGTVCELYFPARGDQRTLSDLFVLFPLMGLAAVGLEEILQRRMPFWLVFGIVLCSAALFPVRLFLGDAGPYFPERFFGWFLTAVFGIFAVLWGIHIWTRFREARRRRLMIVIVTGQILVAGLAGYFGLPPRTPDEARLTTVREDLKRIDDLRAVNKVICVSGQVHPSLAYAIRSLWPDAEWHETMSWEDIGLEGMPTEHLQSTLVIEWNATEERPRSSPTATQQLVSTTTPRFYRGHELRVFRVAPVKPGEVNSPE